MYVARVPFYTEELIDGAVKKRWMSRACTQAALAHTCRLNAELTDDLLVTFTLTLECDLQDVYTVQGEASSVLTESGVVDTRDTEDIICFAIRGLLGADATDRVDRRRLSMWLHSAAYRQDELTG